MVTVYSKNSTFDDNLDKKGEFPAAQTGIFVQSGPKHFSAKFKSATTANPQTFYEDF